MNTKQKWIAKIREKKIHCYKCDQTWYKEKFNWRIRLNYGSYDSFRNIEKFISKNNIKVRTRREGLISIFTSDDRLLDFILTKVPVKLLYEFSYTNDDYLSELGKLCDNISTDIKFIKRPVDFTYQIKVGPFGYKNQSLKRQVLEYLVENSDQYQFNNQVKNRWKSFYNDDPIKILSNILWYDFNVYAKNPDDITLLHIMAPGSIKKITKLVLKEKNESKLGQNVNQ